MVAGEVDAAEEVEVEDAAEEEEVEDVAVDVAEEEEEGVEAGAEELVDRRGDVVDLERCLPFLLFPLAFCLDRRFCSRIHRPLPLKMYHPA